MAIAKRSLVTNAVKEEAPSEDHITPQSQSLNTFGLNRLRGGANAALEIESENQTKTLLRFRSSMPPEMVDGVVLD